MKTTDQSQTSRWLRSLFRRETPAPATVATPTTVEQILSEPANGKKVLIVDDDPVFVKTTSLLLQRHGFEVVSAADGAAALQSIRESHPDLVLMDINLNCGISMMQWDGFALMNWLRRFDEVRNTPFIMVSSEDPLKCVRRALTEGAKAFFHKSTNPSHLMNTVKMLLLSEKLRSAARAA